MSLLCVGIKVLTDHATDIDTTTAADKLVFGIFAALVVAFLLLHNYYAPKKEAIFVQVDTF